MVIDIKRKIETGNFFVAQKSNIACTKKGPPSRPPKTKLGFFYWTYDADRTAAQEFRERVLPASRRPRCVYPF